MYLTVTNIPIAPHLHLISSLCFIPQVEVTCEKSIISDRARMHSLDIGNATDEDLDFTAPFVMVSKCTIYFHYHTTQYSLYLLYCIVK